MIGCDKTNRGPFVLALALCLCAGPAAGQTNAPTLRRGEAATFRIRFTDNEVWRARLAISPVQQVGAERRITVLIQTEFKGIGRVQ